MDMRRNQFGLGRLASAGVDLAELARPRNADGDPSTLTIPDTPEGLEDFLTDTGKFRALFLPENKTKRHEFFTSYARTVMNRDQDMATQVREETQRQISAWLKEHGEDHLVRPNMGPNLDPAAVDSMATKAGIYNRKAMGAAIDCEFGDSAEYFRAIWHNAQRDASMNAKLGRVRASFSSTVPSEGGFLIPESLRSELLRVSLETAVVRPRARVIPMETLRVPFPAIDSTSNASSVYGGIVGYWTEEGGQLTESASNFSRVILDSKKLTAYTAVPNELISDSALSFQAFIDQIFPEALGFYEDDAFMNGNGAGEPLGVLHSSNSALISVTKKTGQAADTIVWENIVAMFARMLPSSLNRAVWVASVDTFPELATMALSVGTGGSAIWLNNGVSGPPMTILGRPVIFTEKSPVLGDAGDIAFIDFGFYLIGDRQVMSAMSSPHYKFQNDQTAFRIIERVDGKPWLPNAITPKNGGNTLSPYVQIQARS